MFLWPVRRCALHQLRYQLHSVEGGRNITKNFNRLSRVHERYRQTTDGRATTYSERKREFTLKTVKTQKHNYHIYLKGSVETPL